MHCVYHVWVTMYNYVHCLRPFTIQDYLTDYDTAWTTGSICFCLSEPTNVECPCWICPQTALVSWPCLDYKGPVLQKLVLTPVLTVPFRKPNPHSFLCKGCIADSIIQILHYGALLLGHAYPALCCTFNTFENVPRLDQNLNAREKV